MGQYSGEGRFVAYASSGEMRAITNFTYGVAAPSLSRNAAYAAFGGADKLDARFPSTGVFAYFTGLERAFFWID